MTLPSILLGLVLSSLYGAAFHFWRGGSLGRLLLYLIFGWVGFWGGHFLGEAMGWSIAPVGALNAGMGTLGSFALIGLGYWLSNVQVERT